jgi:hypothetical protein
MAFTNTFSDKTPFSGGLVLENGKWDAGGDTEGVITADTTTSPVISEVVAFGVAGTNPGGASIVASYSEDTAIAPRMVYEEAVTATDDVGMLTYSPAHVMYVSNDTKAFIIVDSDTTPVAGQVAIDFTTGAMTFAAADSDPTVFVTYWPKGGNKLLADNLEVGDVVDGTPATGHASISGEVITITGGATAIIAVDVDGTPFKPLIDDDTAASGEYEVLWDSTGDTVLTGSGTEFSGATSIKITFIKKIAGFNFVEDQTAHSSDVVTIPNAFYILRTSCYLYTDDNDVPHTIRNSSETLSANEVTFDPRQVAGAKFTYHADTDVTASGIPYVAMLPSEIAAAENTAAVEDSTVDIVAQGTLVGANQDQIGVSCTGDDYGKYWMLGRAS